MNVLARTPLRVSLVAALVVMAALGLVVSGIAVTSAIEQSLLHRTDRQLREAADGWAKPRMLAPPMVRTERAGPPSAFFVRVQSANGQTLLAVNDGPTEPDVPSNLSSKPVTVGSVGDSDMQWRLLATTTQDGTTIVALRLTDIAMTVDKLVALQLGIGALVLVGLGVVAYFVIRASLRPLVEVEETAAAIAAGELHKRVPVRGNRTEVDRLSIALNGMLTQIQQAFAATEASEEAARRSEQRMRRFVADASHELRTPLTTIRGFAELFRQGAATDTRLVMHRIESESARMGGIVDDLLALARLDAQRPLDRKPVDLLALASDAVHDARAVAPGRAVDLEVGEGPGTPEVIGDDARLRQVLSNLVGNALIHTPADATVTVRVDTTEDSAIVQVRDTGPGLPPDAADKVFERFYRADESRTRASGGTGLGLSIVAALVEAHGGTVTVDSVPGTGATFTVALPRDQSATLAP